MQLTRLNYETIPQMNFSNSQETFHKFPKNLWVGTIPSSPL